MVRSAATFSAFTFAFPLRRPCSFRTAVLGALQALHQARCEAADGAAEGAAEGVAVGLVRQPAERRRAFEQRAPGSAWLLSPPGLSHAALSGTLAPDGWHQQDLHRGRDMPLPAPGQARGPAVDGPAGGLPRGPRSGSATEAALADTLQRARRNAPAMPGRGARGPVLAGNRRQQEGESQ